MRVSSRVQLDSVAAEIAGAFHRVERRVDEQRRPDTRRAKLLDRALHPRGVAGEIEPALRRYLLSSFRNESHLLGPGHDGDLQHLGPAGELQIEVRFYDLSQLPHV